MFGRCIRELKGLVRQYLTGASGRGLSPQTMRWEKQIPAKRSVMEAAWVFGLCCQRAIGGSSIAAPGAGECLKGGAARVSLAGGPFCFCGRIRGCDTIPRSPPLSGVIDIVVPISKHSHPSMFTGFLQNANCLRGEFAIRHDAVGGERCAHGPEQG